MSIKKKAALEETSMTDPRHGKPIRISTTVRKKYREYFGEFWSDKRDDLHDLRNNQLNDIIAQDFAASYQDVRHMFPAGSSDIDTRRREWIEIRKVNSRSAFHFFLAVIRPDSVDVISTTTRYLKPKRPRVFVPQY
tara:strand:+ start:15100 stop:15507 length:408 start_codon:yes stop_codon:yes gene_type:complete